MHGLKETSPGRLQQDGRDPEKSGFKKAGADVEEDKGTRRARGLWCKRKGF